MGDHRRRFERWRKKLPHNTAYLVDQVLERIVPEFEARGLSGIRITGAAIRRRLGRIRSPCGGERAEIGPTVELRFHKRFCSLLAVDFGALPPVCKRWTADGYIEIPRERAVVVDAPACFALCEGQKRSQSGS